MFKHQPEKSFARLKDTPTVFLIIVSRSIDLMTIIIIINDADNNNNNDLIKFLMVSVLSFSSSWPVLLTSMLLQTIYLAILSAKQQQTFSTYCVH